MKLICYLNQKQYMANLILTRPVRNFIQSQFSYDWRLSSFRFVYIGASTNITVANRVTVLIISFTC